MNASRSASGLTFGALLKRLRKRAGMTQDDLAAATGYSRSLVGALEGNHRLPDIEAVVQTFLPALGLQDEPDLAVQLVELAALARGQRPSPYLALMRERDTVVTLAADETPLRLPVPPTDILGRDREISQLCNRLQGHHGRLLTLVGPPGVGKTRLALAVGAALQALYRDGACFVPLATLTDPALLASTVLSVLRVHDGAAKSPQTHLIEHLRRKEILLLLDNFEQLLAAPSSAAASLEDLLTECPSLHIIVTSRERLHLRREQRYSVQPLALVAAVDLFVERCHAVDAEFAVTPANLPIIEAICQKADCLPLAVELCAAQLDVLSLAQVLTHLQARRLDLLVDGAQDLSPRHRTLRAAIGHSYTLLDDETRALFRSLGVFKGGGDPVEIEAVSDWRQKMAGPLLPALHALVRKSLVRAETTSDGSTRFLLLETIRDFALECARRG